MSRFSHFLLCLYGAFSARDSRDSPYEWPNDRYGLMFVGVKPIVERIRRHMDDNPVNTALNQIVLRRMIDHFDWNLPVSPRGVVKIGAPRRE